MLRAGDVARTCRRAHLPLVLAATRIFLRVRESKIDRRSDLAARRAIVLNRTVRFTPNLLLILTLAISAPWARAHEAAADMVAAANQLLATLTAEQRKEAIYPLTDAERENWNFVPIERHGLPLKKMSTEQAALGFALLRTGLSPSGVAKASAIMQLEILLKELENDKPAGRRI